jgi:hypothetical protein
MLRKRLPYKCSNLPIHTHFDSYSLEEHILRFEPVDPLPLLQSVICTLLQGVGAGLLPDGAPRVPRIAQHLVARRGASYPNLTAGVHIAHLY